MTETAEEDAQAEREERFFNDEGKMWAGDPTDLQHKLEEYYGVEGRRLYGDFYDEERDEMLYEVLAYFDGDETYVIKTDVPVYGHNESGAACVERGDLPPETAVQSIVEATEAGDAE